MINTKLIYASIVAFAIFAAIFTLFPELDIKVSGYFYDNDLGFVYKNNVLVQFLFRIIPIATKIFTLICLIYLIYLYVKYKQPKLILTSWVFFLFITALIGPGLVVNTALKENFGRARPKQIQEFNGTKEFTPAFVITDQCNKNCSFSSGHAAMGFYFSAIAYVTTGLYFSRIYIITIVFGSMVGLSRIIMGGHFASDVLTSGFIILLLNHLIYLWWKKKTLKSTG